MMLSASGSSPASTTSPKWKVRRVSILCISESPIEWAEGWGQGWAHDRHEERFCVHHAIACLPSGFCICEGTHEAVTAWGLNWTAAGIKLKVTPVFDDAAARKMLGEHKTYQ